MVIWASNEIESLKSVYVETDVPSDALIKNRDALEDFTASNERIGVSGRFTPEEVAGELLRLRKGGSLPRLRN